MIAALWVEFSRRRLITLCFLSLESDDWRLDALAAATVATPPRRTASSLSRRNDSALASSANARTDDLHCETRRWKDDRVGLVAMDNDGR